MAIRAARPYHPKFRPTRLSGCVLWLHAGAGVTEASGGVSQWDDQSGNSNNVVQSTEANRPNFTASSTQIPGRPCLTFNGTSDRLIKDSSGVATMPSGSNVPVTVFAVVVPTSVSGNRTYVSWGRIASNNPGLRLENSNATPRVTRQNDSGTSGTVTASNISNNVPHIYSAVFFGTTADFLYDGATGTVGGACNVGTATLDTFGIGARKRNASDQFWSGDIFEVIIYNRAVTRRERKLVERYLAHKYRLKCSTF